VKWFISYAATNGGIGNLHYGNCVTEKSPAQWAFDLHEDENIKDGPYVILYAEKISEQEFDRQDGWW